MIFLKLFLIYPIKNPKLAEKLTNLAEEFIDFFSKSAFRLQTRMLDFRGNVPTRYRRDMTCRACQPDPATGLAGQDETKEHLKVCPRYRELWQELGPSTPNTRVKYFQRIGPWPILS